MTTGAGAAGTGACDGPGGASPVWGLVCVWQRVVTTPWQCSFHRRVSAEVPVGECLSCVPGAVSNDVSHSHAEARRPDVHGVMQVHVCSACTKVMERSLPERQRPHGSPFHSLSLLPSPPNRVLTSESTLGQVRLPVTSIETDKQGTSTPASTLAPVSGVAVALSFPHEQHPVL